MEVDVSSEQLHIEIGSLGENVRAENADLRDISMYTCIFFSFLVFLGLNPQHMEVPRIGVALDL